MKIGDEVLVKGRVAGENTRGPYVEVGKRGVYVAWVYFGDVLPASVVEELAAACEGFSSLAQLPAIKRCQEAARRYREATKGEGK